MNCSFVLLSASLVLASGAFAADNVKKQIDLSKAAVILPFESSVKGAVGLPEATRTAVVDWLKDQKVFSAVLSPEEAKEKDKSGLVEIGAKLDDFAGGSMATRMMVGMGSGRAHAGFTFTVKDSGGTVLWQQQIKEKASFWSNSASSQAQRSELPERIAKSFIKELNKSKAK